MAAEKEKHLSKVLKEEEDWVTRSTPTSPQLSKKKKTQTSRTAVELSRSVNFLLNIHQEVEVVSSGSSVEEISPVVVDYRDDGQKTAERKCSLSIQSSPKMLFPEDFRPRRSSMSRLFDSGNNRRSSSHSSAGNLLTAVLSKTLRKKWVALSLNLRLFQRHGQPQKKKNFPSVLFLFERRRKIPGSGPAGTCICRSSWPFSHERTGCRVKEDHLSGPLFFFSSAKIWNRWGKQRRRGRSKFSMGWQQLFPRDFDRQRRISLSLVGGRRLERRRKSIEMRRPLRRRGALVTHSRLSFLSCWFVCLINHGSFSQLLSLLSILAPLFLTAPPSYISQYAEHLSWFERSGLFSSPITERKKKIGKEEERKESERFN